MHNAPPRRLNPNWLQHECEAWSPAGQILAVERSLILRECLEKLNGYQMLILVLRYEHDRSFEDIALELNVAVSVIWKAHERIRRILAAELAQRGITNLREI